MAMLMQRASFFRFIGRAVEDIAEPMVLQSVSETSNQPVFAIDGLLLSTGPLGLNLFDKKPGFGPATALPARSYAQDEAGHVTLDISGSATALRHLTRHQAATHLKIALADIK
jgi:hypothetical protein